MGFLTRLTLGVPIPVPVKTRTLSVGMGFWQVRVQVALEYPRVTCDNPYLDHITVRYRKMWHGLG